MRTFILLLLFVVFSLNVHAFGLGDLTRVIDSAKEIVSAPEPEPVAIKEHAQGCKAQNWEHSWSYVEGMTCSEAERWVAIEIKYRSTLYDDNLKSMGVAVAECFYRENSNVDWYYATKAHDAGFITIAAYEQYKEQVYADKVAAEQAERKAERKAREEADERHLAEIIEEERDIERREAAEKKTRQVASDAKWAKLYYNGKYSKGYYLTNLNRYWVNTFSYYVDGLGRKAKDEWIQDVHEYAIKTAKCVIAKIKDDEYLKDAELILTSLDGKNLPSNSGNIASNVCVGKYKSKVNNITIQAIKD